VGVAQLRMLRLPFGKASSVRNLELIVVRVSCTKVAGRRGESCAVCAYAYAANSEICACAVLYKLEASCTRSSLETVHFW